MSTVHWTNDASQLHSLVLAAEHLGVPYEVSGPDDGYRFKFKVLPGSEGEASG